MDNFDRYLDPTFIPNRNDILRARQRTTGGESYYLEEEKSEMGINRCWRPIQ